MRWFGILFGALVLVAGAGLWVRSGLEEASGAVDRFCDTLHEGELWAPEAARARELEIRFRRVSPRGAKVEEYLGERDAFGERFGCAVQVRDGHVIRTHSAQLPAD